MFRIAFSPIYRYPLPEGHRFPMAKYDLLPEQLVYEGTVSREQFFEPGALSVEEILTTHTRDYWEKLEGLALSYKESRRIGFPMTELLVRRGRHIARGSYECALHALHDGIAMNIAGGTHHAYADRGEGFCVFNDFALSARLLLRAGLVERILIADLDVHQGNGTAHIFRDEPRVFTFSMHGERNYPLRKERSDLDIGLPDGTADRAYLDTLGRVFPELLDSLAPQIVLYLAGVDVLAGDKLGRLALSMDGCRQRDRLVLEACKNRDIPVVVSMGGGYSARIATVVEAHANTFREAHRIFF